MNERNSTIPSRNSQSTEEDACCVLHGAASPSRTLLGFLGLALLFAFSWNSLSLNYVKFVFYMSFPIIL